MTQTTKTDTASRPPPAAKDAVARHRACRGKVQMAPKCPISTYEDLAVWYTPGVAAASRAIMAVPDAVYELTNRANTVAVISDGSRVLGLGNIGPEAGLPVMEGKALLFKYFGGVDAVPLCISSHEPEAIVALAGAVAPSFGGINLEDIAAPKCFRVLERLREASPIPVWHDDQQGTATVVLAGLINALEVVGKELDGVRIALIGIGAANMAVYQLLLSFGVDPAQIIACDRRGTLHRGRGDLEREQDVAPEKWAVAERTNPDRLDGGIDAALKGADVCLAFSSSGPDIIPSAAVAAMASEAIVFACANPVPEIWPADASAAGARIVATGRSDFPNQVNNSLAFPGVFRGALDVRARTITDDMTRAACQAIAECGRGAGLSAGSILPRTDSIEVAVATARAVGREAVRSGIAGVDLSETDLAHAARKAIETARLSTQVLIEAGCIPGGD